MENVTLSYRNLNDSQINNIKSKGMSVFNSVKNYTKPETGQHINEWLRRYNLQVSAPSEEFIIQNIKDITFAIINLPLRDATKRSLVNVRLLLEKQLEEPESKNVVLFHEIKGENIQEWSLVNMFDNNVMLWLRLINEKISQENSPLKLKDLKKDSIDNLINEYYGDGDTKSFAAHDLLLAMFEKRHNIFKEVFSKTWTPGSKTENKFISYLISLGVSDKDIRKFSGEGNFVDRAGIDCAIKNISGSLTKKIDSDWIPVQVKPNQSDALKAIPSKGISVYPFGDTFYYVEDQNTPAKKIDELFSKKDEKPKSSPSYDYLKFIGLDK